MFLVVTARSLSAFHYSCVPGKGMPLGNLTSQLFAKLITKTKSRMIARVNHIGLDKIFYTNVFINEVGVHAVWFARENE